MHGVGRACPRPSYLLPSASYGTLEGSLVILSNHHIKGEAVLMLGATGLCGGQYSSAADPILIEHILLSHGPDDGRNSNIPPLCGSQRNKPLGGGPYLWVQIAE